MYQFFCLMISKSPRSTSSVCKSNFLSLPKSQYPSLCPSQVNFLGLQVSVSQPSTMTFSQTPSSICSVSKSYFLCLLISQSPFLSSFPLRPISSGFESSSQFHRILSSQYLSSMSSVSESVCVCVGVFMSFSVCLLFFISVQLLQSPNIIVVHARSKNVHTSRGPQIRLRSF